MQDLGGTIRRYLSVGEATGAVDATSGARSWRRLVTTQDAVMLGYLGVMRLLLARAAPSPAGASAAMHLDGCIAAMVMAIAIARGVPTLPSRARDLAYRATLSGLVIYNYVLLRDVLPLLRADSVDERLFELDLRAFGVEPALWLERFATRPVVEWFSFFYFSYFLVCAVYLVVGGFLQRSRRASTEFALGTLVVYCVGQLGYVAAPGYGPFVHLADRFAAPIDGGFWWRCVWETVAAGGAMKDIFPSLHTAGPTWFAIFAWRRASLDPRWRWPAAATTFIAANIIVSTMLLRWHYLIDVGCGRALACTVGLWLAPRLVRAEEELRTRRGWGGVWPSSSGG